MVLGSEAEIGAREQRLIFNWEGHPPNRSMASGRCLQVLLGVSPRHSMRRMPTVLRVGPYRFFFYAGDGGEPPHVHVERDDCEAKFWLDPIRLERSGGFSRKEINRVQELIEANQHLLLESWNEFFGS
jgi:hypothetical protein